MSISLLDLVDAVEAETNLNAGGAFYADRPAPNSSFSPIFPTLQIAHDSTSIKAGKKCWRYYKYKIIDGRQLGDGGTNPHIFFGHLFHAATELYTKLKIGNWDWRLYRQLRRAGVSPTVLRASRFRGLDHDPNLLVVLRFLTYYSYDHLNKRPWISTEPTKTLKTLLRTTIWYLDFFKDETLETLALASGKPAVELSFRFSLSELGHELLAPTGEEYLLCGHMDRVVRFNGEIFVLDKKTTKYPLDDRYFSQFSPDIQVSLYSLAAQIIFGDGEPVGGFIIDAGQVLVNGTRFRRRQIDRTPDHFEEWLRDFKRYLSDLEACVYEDHWPMNDAACGFGYMSCEFRPVCTAAPSMRDEILSSFYSVRKWDPLIPR